MWSFYLQYNNRVTSDGHNVIQFITYSQCDISIAGCVLKVMAAYLLKSTSGDITVARFVYLKYEQGYFVSLSLI